PLADGAPGEPARPRARGGRVLASPQLRGDGPGEAEPRDGAPARRGARSPAPRAQRAAARRRLRPRLPRDRARRAGDGGGPARGRVHPRPAGALPRDRRRPPLERPHGERGRGPLHVALPHRRRPPAPRDAVRRRYLPGGRRPFALHWEGAAAGLSPRGPREAAGGPPDAGTKALLAELLGYPGVPTRWRTPELDKAPAPLVTIVYRWGERQLRFFSTVTTFGTPQDVTLQELRIECFFAGDDATRDTLGSLAAPGSSTVPA